MATQSSPGKGTPLAESTAHGSVTPVTRPYTDAFMQACGLVNDHVTSCFRYESWGAIDPSTRQLSVS